MEKRPRLNRRLRIHTTALFAQIIDDHARQKHLSPSAFVRRAIVAALKADGVALSEAASFEPPYTPPARSQMVHHQSAA